MIEVVKDFLPQPVFKYILSVVENEQFEWKWQSNSTPGDNKFKFGKIIFTHPSLSGGRVYTDNELMPLFGMFVELQNEHQSHRTQHLLKMKLNLYPNEGKQVQHGIHKDIVDKNLPDNVVDKMVITSVFNFHTCNGYTCIGDEKVPSIANQIVIFDQTEHYGVTQSDIPRRIVLNVDVKNDR